MTDGRRIFVGDVQGCLDALERLLEKVRFDPPADRLYMVGDLVNKGPDSLGTLRLLITLGAESVLGNHDVKLLELAAGRSRRKGNHTLDQVLQAKDRELLVEWLERRPMMLHLGDVCVVHAAVRPGWRDLRAESERLTRRFRTLWREGRSPFGEADLRFALTARYCTEAGHQADLDWPAPGLPYQNWADLYQGTETVVFGHFARQGLLVRSRLRGLDTGCVYGDRLTAWIAEEDRIESVPAEAEAR